VSGAASPRRVQTPLTDSHRCITPVTEFIVTASSDGHVKFWKKMMEGVEFVKHFHAHIGQIKALVASVDGMKVCTSGVDKAVKFFEVCVSVSGRLFSAATADTPPLLQVISFDMNNMLRLDFVSVAAAWIHHSGAPVGKIALAVQVTRAIRRSRN
jgi:peptidylprolyl isomerase domain and WD repeat-containing protein 1